MYVDERGMATKTAPAGETDPDDILPRWAYHIPAIVLFVVGWGGLAYLTLF
jgi:hypothetical protein